MRRRLESILARLAKRRLRRFKPTVIGVTGSVGKTSTKEVIAFVLSRRFRVVSTPKNYNTEIGLPLTILELPSGDKSMLKWIGIVLRAWWRATFGRTGPQMVVLEYAADKPGDIQRLVDIVRPHVAVITNVGVSHMEFFPSREALIEEKMTLARAVGKDGLVLLNGDRPELTPFRSTLDAKVLTYGLRGDLDLMATELRLVEDIPSGRPLGRDVESLEQLGLVAGMSFKYEQGGKSIPVRLPRTIGRAQVYAALCAIGLGVYFGDNVIDIGQHLLSFVPPPGRLTLIPGIKQTIIIDDTYNAAPDSTIHALDVLKDIPTKGRRIAVLGDMLELGAYSEAGHREVGAHAAEIADLLVAVGPISIITAAAAREAGMSPEKIIEVSRSTEVEGYLQPLIQPGDLILAKGSQGIRLERAVKALMAEPMRASELLVRQEEKWMQADADTERGMA